MNLNEYLPPELHPTAEQSRLLMAHLAYVRDANARVKLTTITDEEAGIRLHVVDSLLALPEVEAAPAGRMLDMGTGGGYPGIPLAIMTGRETVLLDSVKKKCAALEGFIEQEEGLPPLSTAGVRAEELALTDREGFAVITARALSALPSLVELASPLLCSGGVLIALKGSPSDEELRSGDSVASYTGCKRTSVRRYTLPSGDEQRTIIVYRKTGTSRTKLPRRPGMAQRKPFA